MVMGNHSVWSRMTHWLRPTAKNDQEWPELAQQSNNLLDPSEPHAARGVKVGWLRRRDYAIQKLEEGYDEVRGLVGAIQKHMQNQEAHSDQITGSLRHLAETLGRLPETVARQDDTLGTIAEQLRQTSDRWQRLETSLIRLPELAEAQRETLSALVRQMEAARTLDEQMVGTLGGFRDSVDALSSSATTSTQVLTRLNQEVAERDRHLVDLIRTQGRRMTWLLVCTLVMFTGAVVVGILALTRA